MYNSRACTRTQRTLDRRRKCLNIRTLIHPLRAIAREWCIKSRRGLVYRVFNEHSRQYGEIIITLRREKGKGGWVSGLRKTDRRRPSNCLIYFHAK